MWYLTSTNDKRTIYVLPENNITIGRSVDTQCCNFAIPDDPSISRKHATLSITDSQMYIRDLGSKYGTFINDGGDKIEHNANIPLNCNDIIKFGKMGSTWKVHSTSFITCTSTLKGDHLQVLKNALSKLGGVFKSDWDETCGFLTMPAITLTFKVVLALVQGAHIVNIQYWNKCVEAIKTNSILPDPSCFIPQILESTLNKEIVSFAPLKDRNSLFADKKVIFFSRRQFEMYKIPIQKSLGSPLLLSDTKMTKSMLCDKDVIVIQYNMTFAGQDTQAQSEQINDIIDYLKSKGKRVIAEAEIGLAILYCSLSKYCNPDFNFSSEVIKHVPNSSTKESNILAQETQESTPQIKKDNVIIDESLTPQYNIDSSQSNLKRKLSDDADNCTTSNATKKIALDESNSTSTVKRLCEDNSDTVSPKKVATDNHEGDMFNFIAAMETSTETTDNCNKKLNLFKPLKRKLDDRDCEEDLFNFVEEKLETSDTPVIDKSEMTKKLKIGHDLQEYTNQSNSQPNNTVDLDTLRGCKLKELMELNANIQSIKNIKKEDTSEIDEKLKNIDLGFTTIVVRKDLIIKREPLSVTVNNAGVNNFKKFKKVWPVKYQITLVSDTSKNNETINKMSSSGISMLG